MQSFSDAAFILDMDGTLVDNMKVHSSAWVRLFEEIGMEMNEEDFLVKTAGKTNPEIFRNIFGEDVSSDRISELSNRKEELYRETFLPLLKPIDGAVEFLETARELGVKMAVATSAPDENIEFVLDGLNLRQYFHAVVGASDITYGKPHPEIFLKSAAELNVQPKNSLVFEDALNGFEAAHRAGMKSIGIATVNPIEEILKRNSVVEAHTDFTRLHPCNLVEKYITSNAKVN